MMPRRVISVPRRCSTRLKFSCNTRSRRPRLLLPKLLLLQPAWHHCIWLYGRRYGLTKRVRVQRGLVASSIASVKDGVLSAPCEPQWRESTAPEPSLLMIRTDSDPSLPPKIYGSVEFEAEALVEASQR